MSTAPAQLSPRVAALLKKVQANRGRLIFALDATASREATWDLAAALQTQMFEEAAKVGGLSAQFVFYRGSEVRNSLWFPDARKLAEQMNTIRCVAGATQIAGVLRHIRAENERGKVSAAVFVGDAIEERPAELYLAAAGLGVPVFWFQEGDGVVSYLDKHGELAEEYPPLPVAQVFRELARLTNGAYGKFNAGAAQQLAELLRAVAAFAVGGIGALANQNSESARKLLGQMSSKIGGSIPCDRTLRKSSRPSSKAANASARSITPRTNTKKNQRGM